MCVSAILGVRDCGMTSGADALFAAEAKATAGSLQSLCWASSAVGGIVSSYFSGSLVESWCDLSPG